MSCALKLRLLLKSVFCRLRLFSELFVLFPVPCLLNLQLQHLESMVSEIQIQAKSKQRDQSGVKHQLVLVKFANQFESLNQTPQ